MHLPLYFLSKDANNKRRIWFSPTENEYVQDTANAPGSQSLPGTCVLIYTTLPVDCANVVSGAGSFMHSDLLDPVSGREHSQDLGYFVTRRAFH